MQRHKVFCFLFGCLDPHWPVSSYFWYEAVVKLEWVPVVHGIHGFFRRVLSCLLHRQFFDCLRHFFISCYLAKCPLFELNQAQHNLLVLFCQTSLDFLRFNPDKITSFFQIHNPRIFKLNIKHFLLLPEFLCDKPKDCVPYLTAILKIYLWSEKVASGATENVFYAVILTTTVASRVWL